MRNSEERHDYYYKKAREMGYPARSIFKLQEIDKKYHLIRAGDRVLDLGCAPGSWLMYLSEKVTKNGKVVGVDLQEINIGLNDNTVFIEKDINDLTKEDLGDKKFDVIVSDMAPKTSGIKSLDADRSLQLNEVAFKVAKDFLKPNGHFVFKIFESPEAHDFVASFREKFKMAKRYSPQATRKASSEFYVVCMNWKK